MIRVLSLASLCIVAGFAAGHAARGGAGSARPPQGAQPGPEHRWLALDEGRWSIAARIWVPGAAEPIEVEGSSTMEMLWGRYLREEFAVGEGDLAMRGLGIQGYDAEAGEYRAVYCLNTGTSISLTTGVRSDDGRVLTLVSEDSAHDPPAERTVGRSVITRGGEDRRVLEYFTTRGDGPERKRFEMTYTRER